MDTDTLLCCLKLITRGTTVHNVNVIARDQFDRVDLSIFPIALIVNSDRAIEKGTYSISLFMYIKHSQVKTDYWDSYGNPFSKYKMKFPFLVTEKTAKVLQHPNSDVCGLHALFFLYNRSLGLSLKEIKEEYSDSLTV
jgi:hypothetical protein